MRVLRLLGRGLSDTFEQLLPFTLWTLAWWACLLTIIGAPPATVALFAMADPRRLVSAPEWRDAREIFRASWRRGWVIVLWTVPLTLVLLWNLTFWGGAESRFAILVPIWTLMLLSATAIAVYAFAMAALADVSGLTAVKHGGLLMLQHPFRSLLLVIILWLLLAVSSLLVVPLFMFAPAMLAAIVNRFALDGLGITVVDPLAPTEERRHEKQAKAAAKSK